MVIPFLCESSLNVVPQTGKFLPRIHVNNIYNYIFLLLCNLLHIFSGLCGRSTCFTSQPFKCGIKNAMDTNLLIWPLKNGWYTARLGLVNGHAYLQLPWLVSIRNLVRETLSSTSTSTFFLPRAIGPMGMISLEAYSTCSWSGVTFTNKAELRLGHE